MLSCCWAILWCGHNELNRLKHGDTTGADTCIAWNFNVARIKGNAEANEVKVDWDSTLYGLSGLFFRCYFLTFFFFCLLLLQQLVLVSPFAARPCTTFLIPFRDNRPRSRILPPARSVVDRGGFENIFSFIQINKKWWFEGNSLKIYFKHTVLTNSKRTHLGGSKWTWWLSEVPLDRISLDAGGSTWVFCSNPCSWFSDRRWLLPGERIFCLYREQHEHWLVNIYFVAQVNKSFGLKY